MLILSEFEIQIILRSLNKVYLQNNFNAINKINLELEVQLRQRRKI